MRKYDLEDRLVDFAVMAFSIVDELPVKYASTHLGHQLARLATAPALNYGEAQAAESTNDFVHKMKLCLKELRESSSNLKIIQKRKYVQNEFLLALTQKECNELVAIFSSSIQTAKSKLKKVAN